LHNIDASRVTRSQCCFLRKPTRYVCAKRKRLRPLVR